MDDHGLTSEGRSLAALLVVFAGIGVLTALDLGFDTQGGPKLAHVLIEGAVSLTGLAGAAFVARRLWTALREVREARRATVALTERLKATEAEAARWRQEARDHLEGLSAALDRQFDSWQLSPAEKEVALLLLKGLSHKELAEVRSITEATARQQARAVYKKAGLSGRSDLAAFFLEDLLVPGDTSPKT